MLQFIGRTSLEASTKKIKINDKTKDGIETHLSNSNDKIDLASNVNFEILFILVSYKIEFKNKSCSLVFNKMLYKTRFFITFTPIIQLLESKISI